MIKQNAKIGPWLISVAMVAMLAMPGQVSAQQPAGGDAGWYYRMGGALPISPSPNVNSLTAVLNSDALAIPRACGALDPLIAIANALGNTASAQDNIDGLIVGAATAAIAGLPALILQRANPALAELLEKASDQAEQAHELSVASCQEVVEDIQNGQNPHWGWIKTSQRDDWLTGLADPDADSVEVETTVQEESGNSGVIWIGDVKKGGLGQPPLPVMEDTVTAGYNLILGRGVTDQGAPAGVEEARLPQLFATPAEASEFSENVLGDLIVQTCQGCSNETVAATGGLSQEIQTVAVDLQEELTALVAAEGEPTAAELEAVSSPMTFISANLIRDLREIEEDQDRGIYVGRIAAGIALQLTLEKAKALKRTILTGRQTPEVLSNPEASDYIDKKLAELEGLIALLPEELKQQENSVGLVASIVTTRAARNRQAAAGSPGIVTRDPQDLLLQGRVRPE